jgi:hypothetical protein
VRAFACGFDIRGAGAISVDGFVCRNRPTHVGEVAERQGGCSSTASELAVLLTAHLGCGPRLRAIEPCSGCGLRRIGIGGAAAASTGIVLDAAWLKQVG